MTLCYLCPNPCHRAVIVLFLYPVCPPTPCCTYRVVGFRLDNRLVAASEHLHDANVVVSCH